MNDQVNEDKNIGDAVEELKTERGVLRLFRWYDQLIVAADETDARSLLREHYTAREIQRSSIVIVKGTSELTVDCGESFQEYLPAEVVKMCGRGIVPDIG